jgi:hypothetical protein
LTNIFNNRFAYHGEYGKHSAEKAALSMRSAFWKRKPFKVALNFTELEGKTGANADQ